MVEVVEIKTFGVKPAFDAFELPKECVMLVESTQNLEGNVVSFSRHFAFSENSSKNVSRSLKCSRNYINSVFLLMSVF